MTDAPERIWIAGPKPDGVLWHKAFPNPPKCWGHYYSPWVPENTYEEAVKECDDLRAALLEVLAYRSQVAHGSVNLTALARAMTKAEDAIRAREDHSLKSPDKPISGDI